jgi:hypothetical protein
MNDPAWLMKVNGALSAHFIQDGKSVPGIDWAIGLKRGEVETSVMVRSYFDPALSRRLRDDTEYLARTTMGYIDDCIRNGWVPGSGQLAAITIANPPGEPSDPPHPESKPWWKFW